MTETPNISQENQPIFHEATNNKISLKQILEEKLADNKLSTEEAKILQQEMKDVLVRTSKTRKEWLNLSYELRTQFQEAVGTKADGAI